MILGFLSDVLPAQFPVSRFIDSYPVLKNLAAV